MKRRHNFFAVLLIAGLISSCASLTKQQKSVLKGYGVSAKSYAETPKVLIDMYGDCLYKSDLLEASVETDFTTMINSLDLATSQKFSRIDFNSELQITYRLLNKYFQALLDIADVDSANQIKGNIGTLGVNIDSLISKSSNASIKTIPVGFGSIAGNLLKGVGKKYISHKQLIYLRQFIEQGNILLDSVSSALSNAIISAIIQGDLTIKDRQVKSDFEAYLKQFDSTAKKPANFYKEFNPLYMDLKGCYAKAILLMRKLSELTPLMGHANRELLSILSSKQRHFSTPAITAFTERVEELNDLISKFNKEGSK